MIIKTSSAKLPLLLAALALLSLSPRLHAQFITLSSGAVQASVSFDRASTIGSYSNFSTLPYVTPQTETIDTVTSTVTPAFTTSALDAGYSGSTPDATSDASGLIDIFFNAGTNVAFSLAGDLTLSGGSGEINVSLADQTSGHLLYFSDTYPTGTGTTSLTSSGGSLTGMFTTGDLYEFKAFEGIDGSSAATLTGTVDLTLSQGTPEPPTYAMLLGGLALLAFCLRHKSARFLLG